MHTRSFLVSCVACAALLASASLHAECRGDASKFTLEAGRGDEVDMAGMAYDARLGGPCRDWRWHSFFRLAQLQGREPLASDREIWAATFIPYARIPIARAFGANLYGDIGIGVSGLSHTQINAERKMSTGFQFSEIAGLTFDLGGGP